MTIRDTNSDIRTASSVKSSGAFTIAIVITAFFIFVQSLTAGEFITEGLPDAAKEVWTTVHGLIAYPVMVAALVTAVIAFLRLRSARSIVGSSVVLFLATVAQWLTGHAISTLHMDWVTPIHVVLAFVIYGLAIWLCAKAFAMRRAH